MKSLKLRVSSSDITNGERSNPQNCAIARTIKRNNNIKKLKGVSVFHNVCIIKKEEKGKIQNYRAEVPYEAQNFIRNFDHGVAVVPFNLSLNFVKVSNRTASYSLYNS